MGKPRIVLTMIVKNESAVIRRCLESVRHLIDAWCISDTGSTDGTQDIIREVLQGIPGRLIERPWVDFATNRNEAIEAAVEHEPDWLMTLDADEQFICKPGFTLEQLDADIYAVMFRMGDSEAKWPRRVFFRPWLRYKYVLDEVIEDGESQDVLPCCEIVSRFDGHRSQQGMREKYLRDCDVLKAALETEPDNTRYWFYLAQRLMGAGEYAEAIAAYRKRLSLEGGFEEERFQSLFMIGQCMECAGDSHWTEVARVYQEAWLLRPQRAEPLFALACLHSVNSEPALAEIYARAAQRLQRPMDSLVVDEAVYAWRAADLLAGALAEQGKAAEALAILQRLRELPQLPSSEHERVDENIELLKRNIHADQSDAKPRLGPDESTYTAQADRVKREGIKAFRNLGREYLHSFVAQALPSPLRWLWILVVAALGKWASWAGAVACAAVLPWALQPVAGLHVSMAVAASSPLLWLVARRRFQDAPVAALTLLCVGFALRGNQFGVAVALFALLAHKEAAALAIPAIALAWLSQGYSWLAGGAAITAGVVGATGAALAIFGEMAWPMFRAGAKGHLTQYTREHQQGAPHRLLVDLVLVSPLTTAMALFGDGAILALAAALIVAHMLAPVRNLRLILAAELLLRVAAVTAFGWWALLAIPIDIYVLRRLRLVYDPVTAALTSQLGMSK